MMKNKIIKKISVLLTTALITTGLAGCKVQYVEETSEVVTETVTEEEVKINLKLWYSDESLTDYLESSAKDYSDANRNVNITLSLIPETEYIDNLTNRAMNGESVDLYIVRNDSLEEMKLAGIADDNEMMDIYNIYNYCQASIDACTYHNHLVAYPLYFDTTFLLYNRDYVPEDISFKTFDDVKAFAESYEVPANATLSSIFSCNTNDIFFIYGFLGGELKIGGKAGDDKKATFDVNDRVTEAVGLYKALIDYFYIDRKDVDYYYCINGFEKGQIALTIADTLMYERISKEIEYQLGVVPFPDMSESIKSAPLSNTTCVVVNPFSSYANIAESFAKYLTFTNTDSLYDMTGKIPCKRTEYDNDNLNQIYQSYSKSIPKLKILYGDEFYALLEVSMHLMADGVDDIQSLSAVGSYIKSNWNEN